MKKYILLSIAAVSLWFPQISSAVLYDFTLVEAGNGNENLSSQLFVGVEQNGTNAIFKFSNLVGVDSSVTGISFDYTPDDAMSFFSTATSGSDVQFAQAAGSISGIALFSADYSSGVGNNVNGGNPNYGINGNDDWVILTFAIATGFGGDSVFDAIDDGRLKVAIHVQSIGNNSGSDKYIIGDPVTSPVPEPATMLLFGTGIAGLAGIARRKRD